MFSVCWRGKSQLRLSFCKSSLTLKIPSIPMYKAVTDCTVTMETCSRFSSWFEDSSFRPENVRYSASQRWQSQPQERAATWAACMCACMELLDPGLFSEKLSVSTSMCSKQKLGPIIEFWRRKNLLCCYLILKIPRILSVTWKSTFYLSLQDLSPTSLSSE